MEKEKVGLKKGYVLVYNFGSIKVHNYNTADYIDNQVIMLEKKNKLLVIESPIFYENNMELETYIKSLKLKIEGILLSYHMGGGTFLNGEKKIATHHADDYGHSGGGKVLVDGFRKTFGEGLDDKIHNVTDYIDEGKVTIADIEMNIIGTNDGYDIEIPEINSIYTHMLGSDCHSIIAGTKHAKFLIETLKEYVEKNYNLILTSHYIPEGIEAVKTKIAYLETVLTIASTCNNAKEMIEKVKEEYPQYSGINYLEMSAGFFFPEN